MRSLPGWGVAFDESTLRGRVLAAVVGTLYRVALTKASTVFFQNGDDCRYFVDRHLVAEREVRIVAGTGVNLKKFAFKPMPIGPLIFLMVARLRKDKGVVEFSEAARAVRLVHPECRFLIAGQQDHSAGSLSAEELTVIREAGHVELLGYRVDIANLLSNCHVFVLPTLYPEGRPRTIQEALAVGRPVVTTRMPGCHDAILPDKNGWLVPRRDSTALEHQLLAIAKDKDRLEEYGLAARRFAVERYDVRQINRQMIAAMTE